MSREPDAAASETLKPCPFCGGEAVAHESGGGDVASIECLSCRMFVEFVDVANNDGLGAAIAAWNRRAPNDGAPRVRR